MKLVYIIKYEVYVSGKRVPSSKYNNIHETEPREKHYVTFRTSKPCFPTNNSSLHNEAISFLLFISFEHKST
jgi:hypothetical protein